MHWLPLFRSRHPSALACDSFRTHRCSGISPESFVESCTDAADAATSMDTCRGGSTPGVAAPALRSGPGVGLGLRSWFAQALESCIHVQPAGGTHLAWLLPLMSDNLMMQWLSSRIRVRIRNGGSHVRESLAFCSPGFLTFHPSASRVCSCVSLGFPPINNYECLERKQRPEFENIRQGKFACFQLIRNPNEFAHPVEFSLYFSAWVVELCIRRLMEIEWLSTENRKIALSNVENCWKRECSNSC